LGELFLEGLLDALLEPRGYEAAEHLAQQGNMA
jgi:hypothetical protein